MDGCINLQVIPAHTNLASLELVYIKGCSKLRNIPLLSTNIRDLNLGCSDIERIPDCIKALHQLGSLYLGQCRRLTSLPELPGSLECLYAKNCESLETVFFPSSTPNPKINFINCFKLGQQARSGIIRRSLFYSQTFLPGREKPKEYDNRARGSYLNIVLDGNRSYSRFVFCVVLSPNTAQYDGYSNISWRRIIAQEDGYQFEEGITVGDEFRTEQLFIFHDWFLKSYRPEVNREILYVFSSESRYLEIIECGAKFLTKEESIEWSYDYGSDQASEDDIEFEPSEESFEDNTEYGDPTNIDGEKQTDSWSWLPLKKRRKLCFEEEGDRKKPDIEFGPSEEASGSGSDQIHIIAKRVHLRLEFEPSEEAFEAWKKRRKLCLEEEDDRKKPDIEFEPSEEAFEAWKKRRKLCFEKEDDR